VRLIAIERVDAKRATDPGRRAPAVDRHRPRGPATWPRRRRETRTTTATLTENEVERRVEVLLSQERDRSSEALDDNDDHERRQDHTGGVAHPGPRAVGTGEQHGLFRNMTGLIAPPSPSGMMTASAAGHRPDYRDETVARGT
jgi:hypothetical protein